MIRKPLIPRKSAAPTRAEERIGLLACPATVPIGELLGVTEIEYSTDNQLVMYADDPDRPDWVHFDGPTPGTPAFPDGFDYGTTEEAVRYLHSLPIKRDPLFSAKVEEAWRNHDLAEAQEAARLRARWNKK